MPDLEKLKKRSVDELIPELRARKASRKHVPRTGSGGPNKELEQFDDATALEALSDSQKVIHRRDDRLNVFQLSKGANLNYCAQNSLRRRAFRRSIRSGSALLVLTALLVSRVSADFILKCMVDDTSGKKFEETIKQTDTKFRADFEEFSVIQTSTSNKAKMLIHSAKMYFETDNDSLTKLLGKNISSGNSGHEGANKFEQTKETKTINGYETQAFKANFKGIRMTVFVTQGYPSKKEFDAKEFEKTMSNWTGAKVMSDFDDVLAAADQCSGFPIQMVTENLDTNYTLTFEEIRKADLDDREFQVPSDYSLVDPSNFLELLGH